MVWPRRLTSADSQPWPGGWGTAEVRPLCVCTCDTHRWTPGLSMEISLPLQPKQAGCTSWHGTRCSTPSGVPSARRPRALTLHGGLCILAMAHRARHLLLLLVVHLRVHRPAWAFPAGRGRSAPAGAPAGLALVSLRPAWA